jgi:hypothetical protein
MGSFLASLYGGQNKTLNSSINRMGDLAGYSSNVGETGTNTALNYNQGILSGDPTQVAMTLSPEIKTLGEQAQNNKNTVAQFGNRGGGMNAVMAGLDDATRAKLISLMGGLRQGAAQNLQTIGQNNLQLGQQGTMNEAQLAQQRFENWKNSIMGKGIQTGVSALETAGLGAVGL